MLQMSTAAGPSIRAPADTINVLRGTHMQENSVQISSEELIDIIQFTIAHVAGQGCSVDDAKNVYAAWQRFA